MTNAAEKGLAERVTEAIYLAENNIIHNPVSVDVSDLDPELTAWVARVPTGHRRRQVTCWFDPDLRSEEHPWCCQLSWLAGARYWRAATAAESQRLALAAIASGEVEP